VIVDIVPNHTSDEHAWFREALTAVPGSPERERYMFHPGKDSRPGYGDGALAPNNWKSIFGGPAWTRLTNDDGTPGEWYLHLFDTKQPDLNWENPEVHAEMRSVLRFWLDRGVDGFRVDVAHGLVKEAGLPDWEGSAAMVEGGLSAPGAHSEAVEPHTARLHVVPPAGSATAVEHKVKPPLDPPSPFFDQDGVHEIYREWNRVLAEYDGDRMLVAEAWVEPAERLARYVRKDEMQQAFNFDFLLAGGGNRIFAGRGGIRRGTLHLGPEQPRHCPAPQPLRARRSHHLPQGNRSGRRTARRRSRPGAGEGRLHGVLRPARLGLSVPG
jgi:alpha-glucosidase